MVVKQFWMSSEVLRCVVHRPRLTQIGWWDVKFTEFVLIGLRITSPSFINSCRSVYHTQSILLYGQAARAISIG
jgi:hypothetical protein